MRSTAKADGGQLVSYVDHGGTPADQPFTYWDVARDALGLLDELGCAVVGTSGAAEDPEVAAGYRQAAAAWREHGPTPEIHCPALVLHGSADAAYSVERACELAEALPNARPPVIIDGGAHFLSLTDSGAVNPRLRTFLSTTAGLA